MLELEEAQNRILDLLSPLPPETVRLSDAFGRVLCAPVVSPLNLPLFDSSAMDGYAVRASDLARASRETPVALTLAGEIPAGSSPTVAVSPGKCIRVFTGSPLPDGADAVLMQEDVTRQEKDTTVHCLDQVKAWENVRLRGEDIKQGALLLESGTRLGSGSLALLGAVGLGDLPVATRPIVSFLATGSELIEPGEPFKPGKIYESNRIMLLQPLRDAGAVPGHAAIVPDSFRETCQCLEKAFSESHAVITSGGVSVGEHDLVKKAFETLGGELHFWKVAIKPGKPFVFGRLREKFLFGLPGNPVSAFVTFLLLVRPALLRWQGAREINLPSQAGVLTETVVNRGDRRHFVRVHIDHAGKVRSAGVQASHMLHSLAQANALLDMPPDSSMQPGDSVRVLRWEFL